MVQMYSKHFNVQQIVALHVDPCRQYILLVSCAGAALLQGQQEQPVDSHPPSSQGAGLACCQPCLQPGPP